MTTLWDWIHQLKHLLEIPLIPVGSTWFTLWSLVYVLVLLFVLVYLSGKIRTWLVERALAHTHVAFGVAIERCIIRFLY